MSLSNYKPMTARQLREVVADYAAALPDWGLGNDGLSIARLAGPVKQVIWFQKMNYAAYRPTHVVNITPLSMPRLLHQLLDVRHREIEYNSHGRKWRDVLIAMEQQFKPDIREPLHIEEVLALCEAAAQPDKSNDLIILAVLHGWLGHEAKTLEYCAAIQRSTVPAIAPIPEWELSMRSFGIDLENAAKLGTAREFLEAAAIKVSSN